MVGTDKYINSTARIIDTLKLHALEPLRLEEAKKIADDAEMEFKNLTLVMLRNDEFIYVCDMDNAFEHEAITVDADGNGRITNLYFLYNSKDSFYYLQEDLDDWRYKYYLALMRIAEKEKGRNGFDKRWAFDEANALSKQTLVEAMAWNTPESYANMVSM